MAAEDTVGTESLKPTRPVGLAKVMPLVVLVSVCSCLATAAGYYFGQRGDDEQSMPMPLPMLAAAADSSDTMAMATGPISDDAEGVFFLDFITGDLQCLVFYPRARAFGAHYVTNVQPQLGAGGNNSKYIMVTGQAIVPGSSGGARPAASLVYVTNVNTGVFAAYAVPWIPTAESRNQPQSGGLVYVDGGAIRNFQLRDPAQNKPAGIVDPANQKP